MSDDEMEAEAVKTITVCPVTRVMTTFNIRTVMANHRHQTETEPPIQCVSNNNQWNMDFIMQLIDLNTARADSILKPIYLENNCFPNHRMRQTKNCLIRIPATLATLNIVLHCPRFRKRQHSFLDAAIPFDFSTEKIHQLAVEDVIARRIRTSPFVLCLVGEHVKG